MILIYPWALSALALVAAAATAAWFWRSRHDVAVGSVNLWQLAAADVDEIPRSKRRMPPGWIAICLGSVAAAIAMTGPVWRTMPAVSSVAERSEFVPSLTLDAVAAERLADGTDQVYVAVRNHANVAASATLKVTFAGHRAPVTHTLDIPPAGRVDQILSTTASVDAIDVSIGPGPGQDARLEARPVPPLRVATTGASNRFVTRLVGAMDNVTGASGVDDADMVIAVGGDLPTGKPGVAFVAATLPPRWRYAATTGPVDLASANVLADSVLMGDVDLSRVVVRQVRPMVGETASPGRRLVTSAAGTLVLATENPRRVYVAFDPAGDNTAWGLDESFPTLMANAIMWTADSRDDGVWRLTSGEVGLVGEAGFWFTFTPITLGREIRIELWPYLALAAGGLWLLGWWRRARCN